MNQVVTACNCTNPVTPLYDADGNPRATLTFPDGTCRIIVCPSCGKNPFGVDPKAFLPVEGELNGQN